ncbi:cytochrome c-type biogenesis protein CcmH [Erwinia mallotivora]|uniref:Cytochrome c-type biogenesis protein n=1 Tax=Erwinia mallotivora TaxID=69222 RepID=A0A014N5W0_9GAMM|nr:cytochrome c-type biogenesis protein CcmH [Erwinia mallotivora]EXU74758.1 cytochrome C [Erwinia mallotivora]
MKYGMIMLVAVLLAFSALADDFNTRSFFVVERQQNHLLLHFLRCAECRNDSVADYRTTDAADPRLTDYQLRQNAGTTEQTKALMTATQGHFLTSQPMTTSSVVLLWAGPTLFVFIGMLIIILRSRARRYTCSGPGVAQQMQPDRQPGSRRKH